MKALTRAAIQLLLSIFFFCLQSIPAKGAKLKRRHYSPIFNFTFVRFDTVFTAHSLRSLEPQRSFVLLFSVERTENNKPQALRAFRVQKYRVAIDFFSFAVLSTAKENYLSFAHSASLR